ncbi:hypothetical protein ZWY2020_029003 [Hordeum vulgare]|nr:hypothetical protein ZWY2020_029003 [Hordeum vulgare]
MLEHLRECYFDLSGPILCRARKHYSSFHSKFFNKTDTIDWSACFLLLLFVSPVPRIQFDPSTAKSQFVESLDDGLSLFFVILTTFRPYLHFKGWSGMRSFGKEYITAFLIREFLMIVVSCMLDPLLFYVLSEACQSLCCAELSIFYSLGSSFSSAGPCKKPPTAVPVVVK